MEFIDTIIGALIAWSAYRLGKSRERKRKPKPKKSLCGCDHHRSFHVDGIGRCQHLNWNRDRDCGCQKYVGPVTYDELIAQELEE